MPALGRLRRTIRDTLPGAYLIRDEFTTAVAAGAVHGSPSVPGPGVRTTVDSGNFASVANGKYTVSGITGPADPVTRYISTPITRRPGRVLTALYNIGAGNTGQTFLGWGTPTGLPDRFNLALGNIRAASNAASTIVVGTHAYDTNYQLAIVMRASGNFYFIKGGVFTYWTLIWSDVTGTLDPAYPAINTASSPSGFTVDYLRVPRTLWLPTPLLSDGFSAWGTTDGLGHQEGVAGSIGGGGNGVSWSTPQGTWGASGGVASASSMGGPGYAMAVCALSTTDVVFSVNITRAGGNVGGSVRTVGFNDFVYFFHNGTNVQLIKRVGGVDTTLINTAITYVAGAELRLLCEGQKFRLYYNNVLIGSEQTIADASLQSSVYVGIYTTNTGNTFDNLRVYARGTSNEYAALDTF